MSAAIQKRQARVEGELLPEPESRSRLPALEAASQAVGLPRAWSLSSELIEAGYFSKNLLGQWGLAHEALAQHLAEAHDPPAVALRLGRYPEPLVRSLVPGAVSLLLAARPRVALDLLLQLADDPDWRVGEAIQAFGVRPQAERLGPEVVGALQPWLAARAPAVRRAAVEGTRPRGVWVKRLEWAVRGPSLLLPLLEALLADDALPVANAIGNALNDVSKDHPGFALAAAARWLALPGPGALRGHMVHKGLRTLIKDGHPEALALLGFRRLPLAVKLVLRNGARVRPNSALLFDLELRHRGASAPAHLVYEIETPGRHAERPRRKRFHWGTVQLPAHGTLPIRVRERIYDTAAAPLIDGPCRAAFFVNGERVAETRFELRREA